MLIDDITMRSKFHFQIECIEKSQILCNECSIEFSHYKFLIKNKNGVEGETGNRKNVFEIASAKYLRLNTTLMISFIP